MTNEMQIAKVAQSRASRQEFRSAPRMNASLTANAEKKLLIWIAQRLPSWVGPDHLTALGLLAQFGAGAGYAWAAFNRLGLLLAVACIGLNWLGDSLDGTVARVRNCQRPRYGFYVDHVADTFGSIAMMTGLAFSGYLHPQIAIAMLLGFLALSIESFLATYTLGTFHMSQGIFGPTEIRILLAIGTLALLFHPHTTLFGRSYLLFDVGGVIASGGMAWMMLVTTLRHGGELYRQERLP